MNIASVPKQPMRRRRGRSAGDIHERREPRDAIRRHRPTAISFAPVIKSPRVRACAMLSRLIRERCDTRLSNAGLTDFPRPRRNILFCVRNSRAPMATGIFTEVTQPRECNATFPFVRAAITSGINGEISCAWDVDS